MRAMHMKKNISGTGLLYAAALIFTMTSLSVKFASRYFSGLFVSSARFVIGAALCAGVLFIRKERPARLDRRSLVWVILRGFIGAISMVLSFVSIELTGPGRATLLGNTYPLFVGIFGALFFGEKLSVKTSASVLVCTLGAFFVVRDGSGASFAGDLAAIASAVTAGIAVNFVRRASAGGVDPFILYLSPCLFGLPLLAFAPLPAAPVGFAGVFFLVAVGVGAFVAQAFMAMGYKTVSAGQGSVIFYVETALTVALGLLLAGEVFTIRFLAGFILILAGLWINREKRPKAPAAAANS